MWIVWTLATGVGFALAWSITWWFWGIIGFFEAWEDVDFMLVTGTISGFLSGAVVGISQWVAVRSKISRPHRWIWATTIAWMVWAVALAVIILAVGSFHFRSAWFWGIAGTLLGGVMGLAQWWVLRAEVQAAHWWIPASVVGWICTVSIAAAGHYGTLSIAGVVYSYDLIIVIPLVLGGSLAGMVTGSAFVFLFDQSGQRRFNVIVVSGFTITTALSAGLLIAGTYDFF